MSITITGGISFSGGLDIVAPPAGNKAIFGYGYGTSWTAVTNKVSNTGVVATDTAGVGTSRVSLAAAGYSLS